jgi:succinate dehydrogenase / fumarate reductase, cytochrome b subunit
MGDKHDFYPLAVPFIPAAFIFCLLSDFLCFPGFHLSHALQSGFQTLGLNHNKYTPAVKAISAVYAIIISVGFAVIPLYFLFVFKG